MDVPKLGEKLELLFRHDTAITTKSALAKMIGVKPSAITRWVTGRREFDCYDKNRIPDSHLEKFARLFDLQLSWLREPDLGIFESYLRQRTVHRTAWENLLLGAHLSEALKLKRKPEGRRKTRLGYQSVGEVPQGEPFHYYEPVYIELDLEARWAVNTYPGEPLAYVVVIWTFGYHAHCLCPSDAPKAPDYRLTELRMRLPTAAPSDCLHVWPFTGLHSVLALITKQPFSDSIYAELRRQWPVDLSPVLETIARSVMDERLVETWQLLRLDFMVEPDAG